MRIFGWDIRRVESEVTYHKHDRVSAQEIIDTELMLLARFPDDDCVVRNQRTGENVWLRPFGRSDDEVIRGVGSVALSFVEAGDEWLQLRGAQSVLVTAEKPDVRSAPDVVSRQAWEAAMVARDAYRQRWIKALGEAPQPHPRARTASVPGRMSFTVLERKY